MRAPPSLAAPCIRELSMLWRRRRVFFFFVSLEARKLYTSAHKLCAYIVWVFGADARRRPAQRFPHTPTHTHSFSRFYLCWRRMRQQRHQHVYWAVFALFGACACSMCHNYFIVWDLPPVWRRIAMGGVLRWNVFVCFVPIYTRNATVKTWSWSITFMRASPLKSNAWVL